MAGNEEDSYLLQEASRDQYVPAYVLILPGSHMYLMRILHLPFFSQGYEANCFPMRMYVL